MNAHVSDRAAEPEYPGFADYECRNAIRTLIRIYGAEEAQMKVINFLNDETTRSRRYATSA
jgi:hypothetical protein